MFQNFTLYFFMPWKSDKLTLDGNFTFLLSYLKELWEEQRVQNLRSFRKISAMCPWVNCIQNLILKTILYSFYKNV